MEHCAPGRWDPGRRTVDPCGASTRIREMLLRKTDALGCPRVPYTRETGRCVVSKGHPRARPSAARLGHEFSNVVGDQGWEQVPSGQVTTVVCPAAVSGDRSPGLRWNFRPKLKFAFLWRHVARGKVRFRPWQPAAVVLLCWEQTVVSPRRNWRVKATYGRSVVLGPKLASGGSD